MITVSEESIKKTVELFDNLTDDDAIEIGEQFAGEQPYLMAFIQAMASLHQQEEEEDEDGGELLDDDVAEDLNYYAMFLWKAFEFEAGEIPTLEKEEVEEQSNSSIEEIQKLVAIFEGEERGNMEKQFEKLRQPVLFSYLLSILYGELDEEDQGFVDDDANYLFLVSNQVVQMLDQKVNGSRIKVSG